VDQARQHAGRAEAVPSEVQPTHSEDGVDLTLIRWMLSLTPAERVEMLQQFASTVLRIRHEQTEL
jgi:hypothetical protein